MKIPAAESALLVIDMQNGFVHPESGMGLSPSGTEAQQKIVEPIVKLAEIFRRRGASVIWSRQEHFEDDKTRAGRVIRPHSLKQGFLPCLRGTWETEIVPPLQKTMHQNDLVVEKHRASVFYNTNLETKLRMLGTKFLFISGCNTEFCVESTVRDAYARDFQIVVVRDCVAGIQKRFHDHSLEVIQNYFGEVVPLNQVETLLA